MLASLTLCLAVLAFVDLLGLFVLVSGLFCFCFEVIWRDQKMKFLYCQAKKLKIKNNKLSTMELCCKVSPMGGKIVQESIKSSLAIV